MPKRRRGESADFALSQTQVQALLAACLDLDERVTIGCQLFLGLRVSELVHMNISWVTQEGDLRIPFEQACRCAECVRQRGGTWRPKTKAGARTLPIPKRMRKDLSDLFKLKPYGLDVSRIALYYRTKTILKRAKVKFKGAANSTAFPHALRSTCLNMLAEQGMSAAGLAYFAGWSSISVASQKEAREIFG